jgi:glucose-6-phosphate dehydrogenase assembly protein OpcA
MTGEPQPTINLEPARPGEPVLRWSSRARTIEDVERELARIWSIPKLTVPGEGGEERRIAARTSVMNLVVIARRPELGERAGAGIAALTGKHPSRTLIVAPMDPDGPSWLDARVQALCMLPRSDAPETCAESIFLVVGGEAGRRLAASIAPLLVHDLPVTVWWLGDPPLGTRQADDVLDLADRLVVDGSTWAGDGLQRLAQLALVADEGAVDIFDFALVRQARWREAIASAFDRPDLLPYLRSIRRVSVTYASTADAPGGTTNVVKPVYHVAWLASRLGLTVERPLHEGFAAGSHRRGRAATLKGTGRDGAREVAVVIRPVESTLRAGTTLRVELLAERRGQELRVDVTAEAETVRVRAWEDGVECLDRPFRAPRLADVDLLAEAIESSRRDPVTRGAVRMAGALVGRSG